MQANENDIIVQTLELGSSERHATLNPPRRGEDQHELHEEEKKQQPSRRSLTLLFCTEGHTKHPHELTGLAGRVVLRRGVDRRAERGYHGWKYCLKRSLVLGK